MYKCNDCYLNRIKNTKSRPEHCTRCELNYHWTEFKYELSKTWLGKLPYKILDFLSYLTNKIGNIK